MSSDTLTVKVKRRVSDTMRRQTCPVCSRQHQLMLPVALSTRTVELEVSSEETLAPLRI